MQGKYEEASIAAKRDPSQTLSCAVSSQNIVREEIGRIFEVNKILRSHKSTQIMEKKQITRDRGDPKITTIRSAPEATRRSDCVYNCEIL
jgi:hypothetical protein